MKIFLFYDRSIVVNIFREIISELRPNKEPWDLVPITCTPPPGPGPLLLILSSLPRMDAIFAVSNLIRREPAQRAIGLIFVHFSGRPGVLYPDLRAYLTMLSQRGPVSALLMPEPRPLGGATLSPGDKATLAKFSRNFEALCLSETPEISSDLEHYLLDLEVQSAHSRRRSSTPRTPKASFSSS